MLWITSSYNNTWNSQFVGETPREEACRELFATMATHGIPMLRKQFSHSFIHWSRSTLVVIMPKISSYTRTRIELLYSQGFHPAGIFKTLKSEGLQVSLSGITRLIKKLRLNSFVANLPRSGRPKKLSMEARAFIDQQMRRNDETTSAEIRKKLAKRGILVNSSTVRRSRKQQGWTLLLAK